MALGFAAMDADLSCPVCRDVFRHPVLLACSHSYCKDCLLKYWEHKGIQECPVCKQESLTDFLALNLALKNICESYLQERRQRAETRSDQFLNHLRDEAELFCLDDRELVCTKCPTGQHEHHKLCPTQEAVLCCKEELNAALHSMEEKLETFKKVKDDLDKTEDHIKWQSRHAERVIKEEFERLHMFLRDEEAIRIAALREEEEQKRKVMKKEIESVTRQISSLSDAVRAVEQEMAGDDVSLLLNYKTTMERAQCTPQETPRLSGALIDVAQHLGSLSHMVWLKMLCIVHYTPVTLDVNTAGRCLHLSEDLTTLIFGNKNQLLPDNPERFAFYASAESHTLDCVLGAERFTSGRHCWDVEVGDSIHWGLGVASESISRKEEGLKHNLWCIWRHEDLYIAGVSEMTQFAVSQRPQRIRVQLDWDQGQLSFTDLRDNTVLHVLQHSFTAPVFPMFWNTSALHPMRILPADVSVTVE
ncbi:tripartite motif-containing protein 35-like [Megalops cyprinoides]|uniref:tripartite motif-containing protein 35-like n=1 Tax=Megalops cyprinoides TaxID=118141 RepID=UPI00186489D9|nr:tripartite motif-containing protein 35-like [Megalops cyprinoides]